MVIAPLLNKVTCGVQQGSTLGPLLFLVYINDLQGAFSKSIIHYFADDTNLLFPAKKLGSTEFVVNLEPKLNDIKTELIIFRSPGKNLPREPDIRINNYKLKLHNHVKYLGILIDEVLSWNKQIESICMKLARANDILSKLCYVVPKDISISVYYSLFFTHLIYSCLVRSYSRKSNIDCLIKLQKRCIRIINFSDFDSHTDPQYSELNLLKVNDISGLNKLLFMFDFIKENIPEDLKRLFILCKSVYLYETCSSQMFHIPKGKTSIWCEHFKL